MEFSEVAPSSPPPLHWTQTLWGERGERRKRFMSEENKALARRPWEEIVNQQNLDAVDEIYPADIVWHVPEGDIQGSEEVKQFVAVYYPPSPTSTYRRGCDSRG
jgi:hypothetical protein